MNHPRTLPVVLVVTLLLAMLLSILDAEHAKGSPPAPAPVVFVHGYDFNLLAPGSWATGEGLVDQLAAGAASTGAPFTAVSYYAFDRWGPSIMNAQQPGLFVWPPYATGIYWTGGATQQTDIRHLAYRLAWWLHATYTAKGQTVDLVGHSMGGLIIRTALARVAAHDPAFPPALLVEDAVTLSTPHGGIDPAGPTSLYCSGGTQCDQMKYGSPFLAELDRAGRNPQGTGGTDWTSFGAASCDVVTAASATAGARHAVVYPCAQHTDYLTSPAMAADVLRAVLAPSA